MITGQLGHKCACKQTEMAGGEQKQRNNSVVVARTLNHTQAGREHTQFA